MLTEKEQSGLLYCQKFVEVLIAKGLKAYFGELWDGAHDHNDPAFWYFHPRGNGGVGAFTTYDNGFYDMHFLEPEDLEGALAGVSAIRHEPTRQEVWATFDAAAVKKQDESR